ncbi:LEAF RUST 10 DISEASE-RESISTANCE LOCUS RECEPTOR-LIKE PROTEIN KINASE-like 2.7 [Salvia miltiorrhiza]|uniref:LEAF RUST 10 DISEASE-RESISTANCE LOCUS RECEPTOR-LIKE PROTEIN KINASE-like 2.7 n=1 Tax=Salvia miltiorrhiza TaxID=226208 RepID=UPI0025AC495A|nr:LEAF RUST 10 DISEASE-RESISTANCE LOCUS RECEPTOR-LIKE PROTEIN KINASE-like 2.7 [Salvia miltiorrhiza]
MPLTLFSLLITLAAAAYSQTTPSFPNCDRTFSCGALVNISYPFIGGARPSHCGRPDFALTCRSNNVTELTHNSFTYRVLLLDQAQKRLVLSRSDLYDSTCPSQFRNSTLNSTLLYSDAPRNEELTLFYGCNATAMTIRPHNLFNCSSGRFNFSDAYYLVGPVPRDPILRIIYCSMSISLLVLKEVGDELADSRLSLGEALMQGFSVNYSVPEERTCSECYRLSGQCGYDSVTSQLVCVCGDRPCTFALTLPPEGSQSAQGIRNFCSD